MGNELFYQVTIGFNAWMVLAPVMLVLAAVLATQQFRLTRKRLKVQRIFSNGVLNSTALVCGVIFATTFALESWRGVLQWCDNALTGDSGVYSLILTPICIGAVSALYGALVYVTAKTAAWISVNRAVEKRKIEKKRRQKAMLREILELLRHDKMLEVEKQYQEKARRQAEEGARAEAEALGLWRPDIPVTVAA